MDFCEICGYLAGLCHGACSECWTQHAEDVREDSPTVAEFAEACAKEARGPLLLTAGGGA